VRLIATVATVVMGFVYALVTARWLGPADKGVLSTLSLLIVLVSQLACLGLGEATVVLVGQRRTSIQQALSATVGTLLVTMLAATAAALGVASINFRTDLSDLRLPILAACVGVPILVHRIVLTQIVNLQQRFFATSVCMFLQQAVSAAAAIVLLVVWRQSVTGAVVAFVIGPAFALIAVVGLLKQSGLSLRPTWDMDFLRRALPYGVKVQISGPPPITDRIDLVLVYALAGQAAAGHYTIALTIGMFVGMVPLALSYVSFPRLARLAPREALELTVRTCRYGLAAAFLLAAGLLIIVPMALSFVFGEPYAPAVTPTLVLLLSYTLSSAQWLLGRAAAARGNSDVVLWSYAANFGVMVSLDYVLIPPLGVTGAAIASVAGAAVGLAICLGPYRNTGQTSVGFRDFIPTVGDFHHLVLLLKQLALKRDRPDDALSVENQQI
jgi:O-antigen/teichoic acid export membrane protein